jgi:hypothetical protein
MRCYRGRKRAGAPASLWAQRRGSVTDVEDVVAGECLLCDVLAAGGRGEEEACVGMPRPPNVGDRRGTKDAGW